MLKQNDTKANWIPSNPNYDPKNPLQIGGQAVIEGVMMRAPGSVATAVRRMNGEIVVKKDSFASLNDRLNLSKVPIVRGAVGLIDMLFLGIKTLNWSAEIAMRDAEEEEAKKNGKRSKEKTKGQTTFALVITMVIALAIGMGIFFVAPLFLTSYFFDVDRTAVSFNLIAGGFRIAFLLTYLAAISWIKDIKRLFQYHGAEHKAVFAFELNDELLPHRVETYSRFHPRCGTSFLLIVMFVAILSFSLLDAGLIYLLGDLTLPIRIAFHLPFIPIVGGVAYEVIRFSAKQSTTWWGKLLIAPGLWLQRITTKEPDTDQIEIALVALRCALGLEDSSKYELRVLTPLSDAVAAENP